MAISGDGDALQALLLGRYRRLLLAIARDLPADVAQRTSAEDVLQDTFLAAFRGIAKFEEAGEGSFDRWLYSIAGNSVRDAIKRHRAAKRDGRRAILPA